MLSAAATLAPASEDWDDAPSVGVDSKVVSVRIRLRSVGGPDALPPAKRPAFDIAPAAAAAAAAAAAVVSATAAPADSGAGAGSVAAAADAAAGDTPLRQWDAHCSRCSAAGGLLSAPPTVCGLAAGLPHGGLNAHASRYQYCAHSFAQL
jgi:hypothetical protein